MGSGGSAAATMGTGDCTSAPLPGLEIETGNAQRAAGGGSCAGGTIVRFEGGVGVTEQLATFFGSPWHPDSEAKPAPTRTHNPSQHQRKLLFSFVPFGISRYCPLVLVVRPTSASGTETRPTADWVHPNSPHAT